jgi:hypothetical protein
MHQSTRHEGRDMVLHTDTPTTVPFPGGTERGYLRMHDHHRGADRVNAGPVRLDPFVLHDVQFLRGDAFKKLHTVFQPRIAHNNASLRKAWINGHDGPHMDRVAAGTFELAKRVRGDQRLDWQDIEAVTLATRLHDVGYHFPKDQDPALLGKEAHERHAPLGADLVADKLEEMRQKGELPAWWKKRHTRLAHMAILYHSNQSPTDSDVELTEDPSIPPLTLFPRLIDKLDNTEARVAEVHLDALALAARYSINHLRFHVRHRANLLLKSFDEEQKPHHKTPEEVFASIAAIHPTYVHQLVPYAITNQQLHLEPDGTMSVRYFADTSRVSEKLGIDYTNEQFNKHFEVAYTKSMSNAAEVVRATRTRILGLPDLPEEAELLRVNVAFKSGDEAEHKYASQVRAKRRTRMAS